MYKLKFIKPLHRLNVKIKRKLSRPWPRALEFPHSRVINGVASWSCSKNDYRRLAGIHDGVLLRYFTAEKVRNAFSLVERRVAREKNVRVTLTFWWGKKREKKIERKWKRTSHGGVVIGRSWRVSVFYPNGVKGETATFLWYEGVDSSESSDWSSLSFSLFNFCHARNEYADWYCVLKQKERKSPRL